MASYLKFARSIWNHSRRDAFAYVFADLMGRALKVLTILVPIEILLVFIGNHGKFRSLTGHDMSLRSELSLLVGFLFLVYLISGFLPSEKTKLAKRVLVNTDKGYEDLPEKIKLRILKGFLIMLNGFSGLVFFSICCLSITTFLNPIVGSFYLALAILLASMVVFLKSNRAILVRIIDRWLVPFVVLGSLIILLSTFEQSNESSAFFAILTFVIVRRSCGGIRSWLLSLDQWAAKNWNVLLIRRNK